VRDALVVIDVVNRFDHEDADRLLASFRERADAMERAIAAARGRGDRVVYVNDHGGSWVSDAPGLVRAAVEGRGGDVVARLAPQPDDPFLLKARYSIFDHTTLDLVLAELEVDRVLLMGAATEGCVVQSGIDAREHGLKVTILAHACATVDPRLEEVALHYAEQVGGMRIERS
jgi:nicotinamidase-related amidase